MNIKDFGPFHLTPNNHPGPEEGMCVMEMVSFLAGEEWSDTPECASPLLSEFCMTLNDTQNQTFRDRLQTYVPCLIGTVSPEHEAERTEYLAWALVRKFLPAALREKGSDDYAGYLENFRGTLREAVPACTIAEKMVKAYTASQALSTASRTRSYVESEDPYSQAYGERLIRETASLTAIVLDHLETGHDPIFETLDSLLEIGPSGTAYTQEHLDRAKELRKVLVEAN